MEDKSQIIASMEIQEEVLKLRIENNRLVQELEEYKNGNFVQTVNQIIEGKDKQLEQAKEILKDIVENHEENALKTKSKYKKFLEALAKAEQFLKE